MQMIPMSKEQFQQLMAGQSAEPPSPPARVVMAMQFIAMFRTSACSHLDHSDEFAKARVCTSQHEAGAYNAALEAMRLFFNGEMSEPASTIRQPIGTFGEQPSDDRRDSGDNAPPGHGAFRHPPSPHGAPAAVKPMPEEVDI